MRIKALDSIRGLLLLQMTLDHFGKPISHYLYQCFGFFSAAEGFFFLSGFVGVLAAFSKSAKDPRQSWMRTRALKIWKYHCVTLTAIAVAACTFLPAIAENFRNLAAHPLQGSLLSAVLVNTPDYLDVLPLYVLFLLLGSFLFPTMIRSPRATATTWGASLALWIAAQFGLRDAINGLFPNWVHHGFFDLFGWQFVYMTGASIAACWKRSCSEPDAPHLLFSKNFFKKFDLFLPAILLGLVFLFLWRHQFIPLAEPQEIWVSKAQVGLLRFTNFMGFVGVISWIVRKFPNALDFRMTNVIGRHSLDVYSAHIVLVYAWFAVPGKIRYHEPWDIIAPITACILLWVLAKFREPRT